MIKIPPCDLPLSKYQWYQWYHWLQKNVQGFLVTIGKNVTNGTIGRFADFTIGNPPNVAVFLLPMVPLVNDTIGRSHGGIFIILINTPHLFFVFLI